MGTSSTSSTASTSSTSSTAAKPNSTTAIVEKRADQRRVPIIERNENQYVFVLNKMIRLNLTFPSRLQLFTRDSLHIVPIGSDLITISGLQELWRIHPLTFRATPIELQPDDQKEFSKIYQVQDMCRVDKQTMLVSNNSFKSYQFSRNCFCKFKWKLRKSWLTYIHRQIEEHSFESLQGIYFVRFQVIFMYSYFK